MREPLHFIARSDSSGAGKAGAKDHQGGAGLLQQVHDADFLGEADTGLPRRVCGLGAMGGQD